MKDILEDLSDLGADQFKEPGEALPVIHRAIEEIRALREAKPVNLHLEKLDNSGWLGVIPKDRAPHSFDLVFEDSGNGRFLLCHLSEAATWAEIAPNERLPYETVLCHTNFERAFAAILSHSGGFGEIDTTNVTSFQLMAWNHMSVCPMYSKVLPGERWQSFVQSFYQGMNYETDNWERMV